MGFADGGSLAAVEAAATGATVGDEATGATVGDEATGAATGVAVIGAELAGAADVGPDIVTSTADGIFVALEPPGYGTFTIVVGPAEETGEATGAAGVMPDTVKVNAEESTESTVIVNPVEATTPPWMLSVLGNFPPEPGPMDIPAVQRSPASPMFTFFSMS
jgi:hypothetical protein